MQKNQNDLANGEESYVNLTSQQDLLIQQNPNNQTVSNTQNTPAHESSKAKYQRMRAENEEYNKYFKNFLQRQLTCPIGQQIMIDPVMISSGFTFDRMNIQDWIRWGGNTCPSTRIPINGTLITNYSVKKIILNYKQMLQKIRNQRQADSSNKKNTRILISQYESKASHLTIDKSKHLLDHSFKPVNMKYFVRVNWRFFQEINLHKCEIDDKGIELLLQHGKQHFKSVVELNLQNNKITTLKNLQRLPRLKELYIGQNEKLTEQTKQYLKEINENQAPNRRINVHYQIKPL